jgi:hypothetical protein
MTQAASGENFMGVRYLRKDIGVAIVVAVSLLAGWLIGRYVESRTTTFASADVPFSVAYPVSWVTAESLLDAPLMKVQDPLTESAFKTSLTIDSRELDAAAPPTLQDLLDRRVEQRQALTGYHFLANSETAMQYDYTYVVQPADQPRRASLPVVVVAREYIVTTKDNVYYISFATPEREVERSLGRLEEIVKTVKLQ